MPLSDETLMAYADGELGATEADYVRRLVASTPELQARLSLFQMTRAPLAALFDEHLREPLPPRLLRIGEAAEPSLSNRMRDTFRKAVDRFFTPISGFGLVAGASFALLAITVGLAWLVGPRSFIHPGEHASTPLLAALETAQSGKESVLNTPGDDRLKLTIKLTFKNRNQDYCRQYVVREGGAATEGIACHEGGSWVVKRQQFVGKSSGSSEGVSPAGRDGESLDNIAMDMMAGDAFGLDEERDIIRRGWK